MKNLGEELEMKTVMKTVMSRQNKEPWQQPRREDAPTCSSAPLICVTHRGCRSARQALAPHSFHDDLNAVTQCRGTTREPWITIKRRMSVGSHEGWVARTCCVERCIERCGERCADALFLKTSSLLKTHRPLREDPKTSAWTGT